ncbi:MAG: hypothetical protein GY778_05075 [bacterium]|nr:hypothetical protein [bacterium]
MDQLSIDEMQRLVGFGDSEAEQLAALAEPLAAHLPGIAERFYARLRKEDAARAVLEDSGKPTQDLAQTLLDWMQGLFCGSYGREYWHRRERIGRAHVQIQMPEQLMVLAMGLLRADLQDQIRAAGVPDPETKIAALNALLDLELTVMLGTYHQAAVEHIRLAERTALEARLAETEHLANVGQLATTLAHEIKNPLAGISGAIQVIGNSLPPGNPHREVVSEVLSEIDRLDATARDLLIYARPKPPLRKRIRVGPLLQDVLMKVRQEPAIQGLVINYDGLQCAAEASLDANQFRQVMTNLLLNAAQACEERGEVTFRLWETGGLVCIDVVDTGVGIAPEHVARAFEPFYTTKPKGTGLGLSICRWIVDSHGGRITLTSNPDEGTTVSIELPSRS